MPQILSKHLNSSNSPNMFKKWVLTFLESTDGLPALYSSLIMLLVQMSC
uniref:Uncharacterized protein n=1 Tax=Arundo donax TaxID=35708 RepID=A0A0A9AEF9_ARUDO